MPIPFNLIDIVLICDIISYKLLNLSLYDVGNTLIIAQWNGMVMREIIFDEYKEGMPT